MANPQDPTPRPEQAAPISRREFIHSLAASGAGLMLSQLAFAQSPTTSTAPRSAPAILEPNAADVLNIGLIGVGAQGRVLLDAARTIPNLRFKAVCDIWNYGRTYAQRYVKAVRQQEANAYEDYREMLEKEKDLHAVIVATPDWMHAEHTIACLQAGLHVYCEKPLAHTLEDARRIVHAQRASGKLVQVGFQRRSNPRYQHALNEVIRNHKLLGRIGQVNAQWNRSLSDDLGCPKGKEIAPDVLQKYGYASMHQHRNWRWYKRFGGGPALDLGSHQVDVLNWFLGATPKAVVATGGVDYYKTHEWFDTVMALLEYDTPAGPVRVTYQTLTTNGHGGYFETFLGDMGSLVMSESREISRIFRQPMAPIWDPAIQQGVIEFTAKDKQTRVFSGIPGVMVEADESLWPQEFQLASKMTDPYHKPHLVNFFDAIRNGTPLNCPVETGYASTATALAINRAVETGEKIRFKPEDFQVV